MPLDITENIQDSFFGWFESNPGIEQTKEAIEAVGNAHDIHTHPKSYKNSSSEITTWGSLSTFGKYGIATIVGLPRWSSEELKKEAEVKGQSSALALAYKLHGIDCVKYISGPFSFVVISPDGKKLLAAIDRTGQHTLYYKKHGSKLAIGSTATAVNSQFKSEAELSEQGIYDYVYFHMIPSPTSIYRELNKLHSAHCLEVDEGEVRIFPYWKPEFSQTAPKSFSAMGTDLKSELREAVARALEGTKAPGSFLSGGLDSSTVTGMLAELTGGDSPAYAIGFDEDGYDEMEFARNTAMHFGVSLQEYYVTPEDVLNELPTIANSYDEPFGNSSALPAYFCGKKAREDGIDCLLAGDGGDEIFAGNERYAKQQIFGLYSKVPATLRTNMVEPLVSLLPDRFPLAGKAKSYIEQAKVALPERLQTYNYVNRFTHSNMFSERFLEAVDTEEPLVIQRNTYNSLDNASDLCRMLYLDWQYTLADNDLRKVSRMCELAGINVRYPMLDEELVKFSCKVPDKWKLKRGQLRHFYKESLTGWLPHATIHKKKQGFGLPFGMWMRSYTPLTELANDSISRLKRRGFFKDEFLDRLVELHRDDHAAYYGELIWVLTVFDLWLEGHNTPSL